MSQRALVGRHSHACIGVVREHGDRIEVVGVAGWLFAGTLDRMADCWSMYDWWSVRSMPEDGILHMISGRESLQVV